MDAIRLFDNHLGFTGQRYRAIIKVRECTHTAYTRPRLGSDGGCCLPRLGRWRSAELTDHYEIWLDGRLRIAIQQACYSFDSQTEKPW